MVSGEARDIFCWASKGIRPVQTVERVLMKARSQPSPEFEQWYRRVSPRLMRYVRLFVTDASAAHDVVAEACARTFTHWHRLTEFGDEPDAWTFQVARNLCRRQYREVRMVPLDELVSDPVKEPDMPLVDHEVWRAVAALPDRQREAIVLRYVGDLTEKRCAEVLGISEGALSASLVKARSGVRDSLKGVNET